MLTTKIYRKIAPVEYERFTLDYHEIDKIAHDTVIKGMQDTLTYMKESNMSATPDQNLHAVMFDENDLPVLMGSVEKSKLLWSCFSF